MKKFMVKSNFLQAVLFIFLGLCFIPQLSYATPPKSVDLAYDMDTQTLSVTINHYTLSAGLHYIKYVEIKKNGEVNQQKRVWFSAKRSDFHLYL